MKKQNSYMICIINYTYGEVKSGMSEETYLERKIAISELNNRRLETIILKIKLWLLRRK